ncbi:hypothetical protein LGM89_03475 [Burkholderia sp. AU31624]|uniref:hypothetical protein n=1 Tax=unclassified Burkholderia TaxID=2613784 RepID=UPI001CF472DC|nr:MULTISPECIES: hypothetical protein [unclassified Burkholderia]MCA8061063.1 hypothetical protein [Burkholderia sp. AU38729]MCA8252319.1 hypothetical protein [Burkholderia sp. AU31624]
MTISIARRCWHAALIAGCIALPGCHEPPVHTEQPPPEDPFFKSGLVREQPYDEAVSGFMVTKDHAKLIVLGRPVHFVLDLPDSLRSAMSASYRTSLRWSFNGFRAVGGHVKGHFRVVLPDGASAIDRVTAAAHGFVVVHDGLALEGSIAGMRYATQGFEIPPKVAAQLLDRPYTIDARHVTEAVAIMNLAIEPTPITATADGDLVLGGAALVPVELVTIQAPTE